MPQGKFEMKKLKNIVFEIWIENYVFAFWKKWPYHQREMEKNWKKIDFEIWIEIFRFWNLKNLARPPERNKKIETFRLCHQGKIEMKRFENFHFLNFEMKISVWNLKKMAVPPQRNEKNWNEEIIYFVYATDIKNFNNTPIPPMYTTLYHKCKS
jgi:hypothetical protein